LHEFLSDFDSQQLEYLNSHLARIRGSISRSISIAFQCESGPVKLAT
jgi:hypothetical protein